MKEGGKRKWLRLCTAVNRWELTPWCGQKYNLHWQTCITTLWTMCAIMNNGVMFTCWHVVHSQSGIVIVLRRWKRWIYAFLSDKTTLYTGKSTLYTYGATIGYNETMVLRSTLLTNIIVCCCNILNNNSNFWIYCLLF